MGGCKVNTVSRHHTSVDPELHLINYCNIDFYILVKSRFLLVAHHVLHVLAPCSRQTLIMAPDDPRLLVVIALCHPDLLSVGCDGYVPKN